MVPNSDLVPVTPMDVQVDSHVNSRHCEPVKWTILGQATPCMWVAPIPGDAQ